MTDGKATPPSPAGPSILLVCGDLLVTSRVAGAAAAGGVRLASCARVDRPPADGGYDVVILDLQAGDPAAAVTAARSLVGGPGRGRVVVFGPHVADGLFARALAAGADEAIARGELLGGFATLAARWGSPSA